MFFLSGYLGRGRHANQSILGACRRSLGSSQTSVGVCFVRSRDIFCLLAIAEGPWATWAELSINECSCASPGSLGRKNISLFCVSAQDPWADSSISECWVLAQDPWAGTSIKRWDPWAELSINVFGACSGSLASLNISWFFACSGSLAQLGIHGRLVLDPSDEQSTNWYFVLVQDLWAYLCMKPSVVC